MQAPRHRLERRRRPVSIGAAREDALVGAARRAAAQLRAEGLSDAAVESAQIEIVDHDDGKGRVRREVRVQIEDEHGAPAP